MDIVDHLLHKGQAHLYAGRNSHHEKAPIMEGFVLIPKHTLDLAVQHQKYHVIYDIYASRKCPMYKFRLRMWEYNPDKMVKPYPHFVPSLYGGLVDCWSGDFKSRDLRLLGRESLQSLQKQSTRLQQQRKDNRVHGYENDRKVFKPMESSELYTINWEDRD